MVSPACHSAGACWAARYTFPPALLTPPLTTALNTASEAGRGLPAAVDHHDVLGFHRPHRQHGPPAVRQLGPQQFFRKLRRARGGEDAVELAGLGTGGMQTKVEAARIATGAGIPVVLTAAEHAAAALAGEGLGFDNGINLPLQL